MLKPSPHSDKSVVESHKKGNGNWGAPVIPIAQPSQSKNSIKEEHKQLKVDQDALKVDQDALKVDQDALKVDQDALKVEQDALKVEQDALKAAKPKEVTPKP